MESDVWPKTVSLIVLFLVFVGAFVTLLPDVEAVEPEINYVRFLTSIGQVNVYWDIELGAPILDVDCELNGDPSKTCTYSGDPGTGGCTITGMNLYNLAQDGGNPRSASNVLVCDACDNGAPADCDQDTQNFYPINFVVDAPPKITVVVGDKYGVGITVMNNGTLTDGYNITLVSSNSEVLFIQDGKHTIETLDQGRNERFYIDTVVMSSEVSADAYLTVESKASIDHGPSTINYQKTIPAWGSDKSLPDFGVFGLLQIMLAAAVLVSFLF